MKSKLAVFCCLVINGVFLSNINQILAQTIPDFSTLSRETVSRLNGNCQGSTEVSYTSQKLTAPDGLNTVSVTMTLRRFGQNYSRSITNDYLIKCNYNLIERPAGALIIEKGDTITRKPLYEIFSVVRNLNGYIVANPISFSPDGRYLLMRLDVEDGEDQSRIYHILLDSNNDYRPLSFSFCEGLGSDSYVGFTSPTDIVFACNNPTENELIEVLNLEKRSRRRLTMKPGERSNEIEKILAEARSYGTVNTEFSIVKEQQFPPR